MYWPVCTCVCTGVCSWREWGNQRGGQTCRPKEHPLLSGSPTAICRPPALSLAQAKAGWWALTVTTAGQLSLRCRSRGTMLWCTWVRRPLSALPAIAATRSPNSAMAAARILSRSCKVGAQSHSQACLGVLAPTPLGALCSVLGTGSVPSAGPCSPGSGLPGWVTGRLQETKIISLPLTLTSRRPKCHERSLERGLSLSFPREG